MSTKNSEAAIRSWLPEIGEWYQLSKNNSLWCFDSREEALVYFQSKKPNDMINLIGDEKWLFITNIHLHEGCPALVDFMVKSEQPQKVRCLPLFPPADLSTDRIWEHFLERRSK